MRQFRPLRDVCWDQLTEGHAGPAGVHLDRSEDRLLESAMEPWPEVNEIDVTQGHEHDGLGIDRHKGVQSHHTKRRSWDYRHAVLCLNEFIQVHTLSFC